MRTVEPANATGAYITNDRKISSKGRRGRAAGALLKGGSKDATRTLATREDPTFPCMRQERIVSGSRPRVPAIVKENAALTMGSDFKRRFGSGGKGDLGGGQAEPSQRPMKCAAVLPAGRDQGAT